jgi:hypothetical protein
MRFSSSSLTFSHEASSFAAGADWRLSQVQSRIDPRILASISVLFFLFPNRSSTLDAKRDFVSELQK